MSPCGQSLILTVFCVSAEPNSFEKKAGIRVDGNQLGVDFTRLRKMMSEFKLYRDAGLFGPDVGQPRDRRADLLERSAPDVDLHHKWNYNASVFSMNIFIFL